MGSENLERRLRTATATSDGDELNALGWDLLEVDRLQEAERCFRRALELDCQEAAASLGCCLACQEQWTEALSAFEVAVADGDRHAWIHLGHVLHELGDLAGEMRAYTQAEEAGDSEGPLQLAFSLREQGEPEAAMSAAQRAAAAGNQTAAAVDACWQWCTTEDPALEPALRAGAELFGATRADLGHLLLRTDRVEEARQVWTHGAELGEVESMLPLGNLYADVLGDEHAAEACYRQGIEHGDAHCHHNLAVLLEERDELEGAEAHYRMAIEGGDTLAIQSLRELLND